MKSQHSLASTKRLHLLVIWTETAMRISPRLFAVPSGIGTQSSGLRPVPHALLPPIPLYRRLLRAHRKFLPAEMRVLGDDYVKSEFRAHRAVENPLHIVGFLTEWQTYAQQIEGDNWRGAKMDKTKIDKMSGRFDFLRTKRSWQRSESVNLPGC